MCACAIASEASSFFLPLPHLLTFVAGICFIVSRSVLLSTDSLKKPNHVCDIIMLQPFRPLLRFIIIIIIIIVFIHQIWWRLRTFLPLQHRLKADARVDFELVSDPVADTLHQPELLTTAVLQQQVDSAFVARTDKTNEWRCASWGESTEDGHYCYSRGILPESTSCSALLVKYSILNQTDNPCSSSSDQNFNLMQRISHKLGTSFQFK